jgi:hypothetical protein
MRAWHPRRCTGASAGQTLSSGGNFGSTGYFSDPTTDDDPVAADQDFGIIASLVKSHNAVFRAAGEFSARYCSTSGPTRTGWTDHGVLRAITQGQRMTYRATRVAPMV